MNKKQEKKAHEKSRSMFFLPLGEVMEMTGFSSIRALKLALQKKGIAVLKRGYMQEVIPVEALLEIEGLNKNMIVIYYKRQYGEQAARLIKEYLESLEKEQGKK